VTTAGDEKAARTADEAAEKAEAADFKSDVKGTLLADLAMLREQRTALVDRTNAVLDALETKGGDVHVHHTAPKGDPPVTEISPAAGEHLVS